jgi:predicted transcriptional regulator
VIRALLSIKPRFAHAIFNGQKKFEYRRSVFQRRVNIILVYVTAPVGQVVGEFDVVSTIHEPVADLWERTKSHAGIEKHLFFRYFKGKEFGYAIEVGRVRIYDKPFSPIEHLGVKPPQSFIYLDLGQV